MSDTATLRMYRKLQNGLLQTQNVLSSVLPSAGAAFSPVLSLLETDIRLIELEKLKADFEFEGPNTAALMRRYRLAEDLHLLHPKQYSAPEKLARPPVVEEPISVVELQLLYRLNCQSLPETVTYSVPAYELTIDKAIVSHCSICELYGEKIRNDGGELPLHLSREQAIAWLSKLVKGKFITDTGHWNDVKLYDGHLDTVDNLNDKAIEDTALDNAVLRAIQLYRIRVRNAIKSGEVGHELIWEWQKLQYRIRSLAPAYLKHWAQIRAEKEPVKPVVVETPKPVEPKPAPKATETPPKPDVKPGESDGKK